MSDASLDSKLLYGIEKDTKRVRVYLYKIDTARFEVAGFSFLANDARNCPNKSQRDF